VAIIGSVYASVYGSHLVRDLPARVPLGLVHVAHQSVGAALTVAGRVTASGHAVLGGAIAHASSNAFIDGLSTGCLVAAGVAAAGAVLALAALPAQPATTAVAEPVAA
jgi:hypothetical protein